MTIKTKLPAKLDTETFLSTSHFKIGKEPDWLQNKEFYKSTFQNDYAPKFKAKTKLSKKPPPATILQKDDSVYEQCSVSREQFVKKIVKRSPACKSLNQTNFKMDKDKKIETFLTTQASSYKVKSNHEGSSSECQNRPMESHIPQGDTEKETWPESDYTNNFYEKKIDVNNLKRFKNNSLSKTIQGDVRSHRGNDVYNTTTNDMYPPIQCQIKSQIPNTVKYPKTSIPCGDETSFISTQKSSFNVKQSSVESTTLFNKEETVKKLQQTSFVSGDHRLVSFETTMDHCYPYPKSSAREHIALLEKRKKFYNNITIPTTKMISSATSDYVAPPSAYRNRIVDGSSYHTASDVCLGNDKQIYYTTSMQHNFPPKMSRYIKNSTIYSSNIPLQYYENVYAETSYNLNFSPRKSAPKKLLLNNGALQNLRNSHICEQQKGLREFKTTHNELFTYKGNSTLVPIETGRLQKSSVPLGTMTVCHS